MSRYDAPDSPETMGEPGAEHGVLMNRLGIKTVAEIEQMETALLVRMKEWSLDQVDDDTRLTSALIVNCTRFGFRRPTRGPAR